MAESLKQGRMEKIHGGKGRGVIVRLDLPSLAADAVSARAAAANRVANGMMGSADALGFNPAYETHGRILLVQDRMAGRSVLDKEQGFIDIRAGRVKAHALAVEIPPGHYDPGGGASDTQQSILQKAIREPSVLDGDMPVVPLLQMNTRSSTGRITDVIGKMAEMRVDAVGLRYTENAMQAIPSSPVPIYVEVRGNQGPLALLEQAHHAMEAGAQVVIVGELGPLGENLNEIKTVAAVTEVVSFNIAPDQALRSARMSNLY